MPHLVGPPSDPKTAVLQFDRPGRTTDSRLVPPRALGHWGGVLEGCRWGWVAFGGTVGHVDHNGDQN